VFYNIFDWVEGSVHQGNVVLSGYVDQPWRKEDYELKGSVADPLERQEIESIVRSGVLAFNVVDDLSVDQG
jgi:hypothetical protein